MSDLFVILPIATALFGISNMTPCTGSSHLLLRGGTPQVPADQSNL